MSSKLGTYLQDHYAGSRLAVELLDAMSQQHEHEPLGRFADALLKEVERDREVLLTLLNRVDGQGVSPVKQAGALISEKFTRYKLHRRKKAGLGTLETLETLALGILGKRSLWLAMADTLSEQPRMRDIDFQTLIARAQSQYDRVEEYRMEVVRDLFGPLQRP